MGELQNEVLGSNEQFQTLALQGKPIGTCLGHGLATIRLDDWRDALELLIAAVRAEAREECAVLAERMEIKANERPYMNIETSLGTQIAAAIRSAKP